MTMTQFYEAPGTLVLGFVAGFLSHLIFQGAFGSVLYAASLLPALPWSLAPVPPLAVPSSLSLGFWAGLWGVVYVLLEGQLTALLGWWAGGLVFRRRKLDVTTGVDALIAIRCRTLRRLRASALYKPRCGCRYCEAWPIHDRAVCSSILRRCQDVSASVTSVRRRVNL